MKMRSFTAPDMQDALQQARDSIGDDAVILSSERQKDGQLVVTFALDRDDQEEDWFDEETSLPNTNGYEAYARYPIEEEPVLANQQPRIFTQHPLLSRLMELCEYHGIQDSITTMLLEQAQAMELPDDADIAHQQRVMGEVMEHCFRFEPLDLSQEATRVILVGPPGAGKTICAAKMAAKMVVDNLPVRVISTDTKRAGGNEQLLAFLKILGLPLDIAYSRQELRELLKSYDENDRIIIDSAGCNPYDFQALKELGEFAKVQAVEPILVCAAGTDAREASEIASVFSFLDIERVILSRVDAARHYGSALALLKSGDYALSHITSSAKAMGNLQPGSATELAQLFTQYQRARIAA